MGGHRFQCCVAFSLPPCHFGYRLPKLPYSFAAVCKQILLKSFKKQPKTSSCAAPSFLLYCIKSHLILLNSTVSLSTFFFLPRNRNIWWGKWWFMLEGVTVNRKGEGILQDSCSHRSHRRKKHLLTACCYPLKLFLFWSLLTSWVAVCMLPSVCFSTILTT